MFRFNKTLIFSSYRHRKERSDAAIQSPSFKQRDWIASSAKASSQ
ncbi:MAG: hypothetical protein PHW63_01045 [Alphaproteobacteria bacterium]|nr:hypothetical protein [Alphaproteobacteria bacterium]